MAETAAPSFASVAQQQGQQGQQGQGQQQGGQQSHPSMPARAAAPTGPGVSLYIGDLHPEVTEAVLFEKFNPIGPVQSIRVCRDAITRRSLGYAYVNFTNTQDAEKAMDALNFEEISGRPCRIMWSQRDPSVRRSGVGNIFIKNLDRSIDNKALYDTFEQFGKILSCKVVCDPEGNSRGFAFVHFETNEAAETAIEKVNGMMLEDRQVYVGPFKSRRERLSEYGHEKKFTNVYVKNVPVEYSEDQFAEMFSQYGEITSRKIMIHEDGSSKGFGFVAFKNPEDAKVAVEQMNGKTVGDKELFCARAQKKTERLEQLRRQFEERKAEMQKKYSGVNLYVKNLEDTVDDEQLREAFSKIGNITSAKVMKDEKGVSRGFGFVCFSSAEEATKAVTEMSGFILGSKPLYVSLHQRKAERQQQLAQQRLQRSMQMRSIPMAGMYGGQPSNVMYQMQMPYRQYPPQMGGRGARMYPQANMMGQGNYRGAPMVQQGRGRGQGKRQPQAPYRQQQVRNAPPQQQQPAVQPQQAINQPGQEPLTASALAAASTQQQKQMLGERLYPLIQSSQPELAGKITGMLLEMDNSELLHLLEDNTALDAKMEEALRVLHEHAQSTGQSLSGPKEPPK